ncbi:hypothetical protein [Cytobacillus praedii]
MRSSVSRLRIELCFSMWKMHLPSFCKNSIADSDYTLAELWWYASSNITAIFRNNLSPLGDAVGARQRQHPK